VAEDLSFIIKGDASDLIDEFHKLGVTSKNISEKISREFAEALGGEFTTKVGLEVEADTGQLKLVQRETNSFIEALVKGLQRIEKEQAKLAAAQAKAAKQEQDAANRAYDKWEQNQAKKRRIEEKDAAAREAQRQKEEAAAAKAAQKAIADGERQYNAYLQNLLKRQAAEQAAEAKRLADIRKTNEAAEKAAAKQEAIAAKLRAEQEKINAAAAKEAQIRAGSVNDLSRRLQKEQETLNNLKRGTAEYEKQAKIVQELSRAKKIEITGLSGKDLDAKAAQANLGALLDGFNRVSFAASAFLGIVGSISNAFGGFVRAQADLQAFELSFKAIGTGTAGAAMALSESSKIALSLGADINTVRDGFQRLSPVILQSGGTLGDVSAIVQSLSSRFAVFGKSAAESQRIMNGVIQAFGKGKLMAEELNQQISEADPAFRVDLANAIGVSVAKLNEMVKAGELTSAELIKFIPLMSKASIITGKLGVTASSAADALGKGQVTIAQFQAQLATLTQLNIEALGPKFAPLGLVLAKVTAALVDFITTLTKSQVFNAIAAIVNSTAQAFGTLAVAIIKTLETVVKILEPIGTLVDSLLKIPGIATLVGYALTAYIITTIAMIAKQTGVAGLAMKQFGDLLKVLQGSAQLLGNVFQQIADRIRNFGNVSGQAIQKVQVRDLGNVANGLKQIGPAADTASTAIVKYDAAQASAASKTASVASGVATQARSFLGAIGPSLAFAAAIYGVSAAYDAYQKSLGNSSQISESISREFLKIDQATQDLSNNLGKGAKSVSLFAQSLDELSKKGDQRNLFQTIGQFFSQENQQNANGFANEIQAISQQYQLLTTAGLNAANTLKNYAGAQKASAEQTILAEAAISSYLAKLNVLLAETIKARDAAKLKAEADGILTEQEKQMLLIMDQTVLSLQNQIKALQEAAKAKGLNVSANRELGSSEEQLITKLKDSTSLIEKSIQRKIEEIRKVSEARIADAEKAKQIASETAASEIAAMEKTLEKIKEVNAARIAGLEEQKAKSLAAFDVAISRINAEKAALKQLEESILAGIERRRQAMNSYYDAELSRIDQQRAAIDANYNKVIGLLNVPGPAEQKLKELEIARLRKQAAEGETAEERLRAQAQLERIQREEQIAILRQQQAQKQAALDAKERELKKKQAEEQKKLDEEAATVKRQIKEKEMELDAQLNAMTTARKNFEKKMDEEIFAAKKKAQEQEDAMQKKIKAAKEKAAEEEKARDEEITKMKEKQNKQILALEEQLKEAKDILQDATEEVLRTEQAITVELRNQLQLAREIAKAKSSGGNNKFAGGAVSGGTKYTVNELGQEAFLSRSGQLSMINAPSWGQWRAPGAGTVIPAHITAGLNIPKNGVPVNIGANKNAGRVDGSGVSAALLRAFSGDSQGRVTNNVTIQSQNPVTDASRMIVEMSKLRTRRR